MEKIPSTHSPSELFKCLSDPYRLCCVLLISKHTELCVCDLMQMLSLSQPKISRYLSDLRKYQILTSERRGQWVYYQLSNTLPEYAYQIISILENSQLTGLPTHLPLDKNSTC